MGGIEEPATGVAAIRVEPILFVLTLYSFLMLALGRRWWQQFQDARREEHVGRYCRELIGQPVQNARARFGEPFAVSSGSTRTLYEWKSPPSRQFPPGSGLLILYLVEERGEGIVSASWETRSEGVWRSGSYGT
ncbi:MAG: hypothetical protein H7039_18340 [Bryobacteraceae bacterium]|nr:hypothetical protein [Bryobacteraceae bacterium]